MTGVPGSDEFSTYGDTDVPSITTQSEEDRGAFSARGFVWGLVAAIVVGWIPLLGAILAGAAGGWAARSRYRALYAMLLPAAVTAFWGFFFVWFLPYMLTGSLLATVRYLNAVVTGGSNAVFAALVGANFILCILAAWFVAASRERDEEGRSPTYPRPV
jgi:hypothetical protein